MDSLTVKVELSDELHAYISEAVATVQAASRRLAPQLDCSGLEWARRISWVFNHYINDRGSNEFDAMSIMGGFLFNWTGSGSMTPMEAMRRDDLETFTRLCERFIAQATSKESKYGEDLGTVGPSTLTRSTSDTSGGTSQGSHHHPPRSDAGGEPPQPQRPHASS